MMMVTYTETPDGIEFDTPRRLFDTRHTNVDGTLQKTPWSLYTTRGFDVSPDGKSFLALMQEPPPPPPLVTHINVIYYWMDKVTAKVGKK